MDLTNLHLLSACEAARLIRDGVISSEQFVEACLARIREVEEQVQAWTFLDPEHALAQARAADAWRSEGRATGPCKRALQHLQHGGGDGGGAAYARRQGSPDGDG